MATTEKIRPDGIDTDNANWAASHSTKFGDISDQDDATYITSPAALEAILFTCSPLIVAGNTAVERLILKSRVSGNESSEYGPEFKFAGTTVTKARNNFASVPERTVVELEWDITLLRPEGGQWIVDDVNNLSIGVFQTNWSAPDATGQVYVTEMWLEVTYAQTPSQLPAPREVASRILRQRRGARKIMSGRVPPEFLDLELLTDLAVVHQDAPTDDGEGYTMVKYKRGLFRLTTISIDMNDELGDGLFVDVEAVGLREYAVNLWDLCKALSAGPQQDGCPILDGGQARTFTRNSPAFGPDPSDGRVVGVQYDLEAIFRNGTYIGRLLEGPSKNYLTQSSFAAGAAPYTDTGTGYNASAIDTVEYADWSPSHLFDPKISRYYTRFKGWTSGSPAPAHMRRGFPASETIPAGTSLYLSLDRRHTGGAGGHAEITVWLRREFDAQWYQWDGTWGAEATGGNTVAPSSSPTPIRYSSFGAIPSGANDSTFTLFLGFDKTLANGKEAFAYHAQLEANSWASSRIVTYAATVTRDAAILKYSNPQANRIWSAQRGAWMCKLLPNWSEGVIAAGSFKTVAYCFHNADNYAWLYWDKNNTRWVFEVCVAGTVKRAIKSTGGAPVSNTVPVAIAARWTSSETELGLTAYTISIFVDGVKGTDDVAAGAMVELDASDAAGAALYIGVKSDGSEAGHHLDGLISDIELVQYVPDDTEIARSAL